MANIVISGAFLGSRIARISRIGQAIEILTTSQSVRPGISRLERDVVGETLGNARQQTVITRGSRVLLCTHIGELRARQARCAVSTAILWRAGYQEEGARTPVREARWHTRSGIGNYLAGIQIALTEH